MDDLKKTVLKDFGVSDVWLEIADEMGYEKFISLWQRLSDESEKSIQIDVFLPKFKGYLNSLRDSLILALAAGGMSSREIKTQLEYEQGITMSMRNIQRIKAGIKDADYT